MGKHSRMKSRKRSRDRSRTRDHESTKENRRYRSPRSKRARSHTDSREHSRGSSTEYSRSVERQSTSIEDKLDRLFDLLAQSEANRIRRPEARGDEPNLPTDIATHEPQLPPDEQEVNAHREAPVETTEISYIETMRTEEHEVPQVPENRSVTFVAEAVDLEHDVATFKRDLMGADLDDAATGPPVHDLIAKTWTPIFTNGLSKETRLALRKKYPVPQNLPLATAPTLNIEVRQAIPATSVKRDEYQSITQGLVEAAISAQASLMTELLKQEEHWDAKRIFETASDASRLLSHVQFHISKARRALITPMLTPSAKHALDTSPIDKQLFGEQYLSKMKEAAAADKLVKSLTTVSMPASKPSTSSTVKAQPRPRAPLQGNLKAFAYRPTSRRGAKVVSRSTRHRSNSQTRSSRSRL